MIQFIPLGGFLGAGKTTTMLAAARLLEDRGERVSLITNDQGADLVDTKLAKASGISATEEVTGGCFCCRFEDLATVVTRLVEQVKPTTVIAEAVGSCTDLQSTVVRPLRRLYGDQLHAAALTVTVDPVRHAALAALTRQTGAESDLAYLYRHQLDEADIIALNKTDLLTQATAQSLVADLTERFPHARLATYSALTGTGLGELVDLWRNVAPADRDAFPIDYDRYADAEAGLAWTNQTFTVTGSGFFPGAWTSTILERLSSDLSAMQVTIGHIKVWVTAAGAATKASLTHAGAAPTFDQRHADPVDEAHVTFNARVQLPPDQLGDLISTAITAADSACGTRSSQPIGDIFQPAYPTPVHR